MSNPSSSSNIYSSESQDGIFNLLFVLASEYSQTMPYPDAIIKASDWVISMANAVKEKVTELDQSSKNPNTTT